MHWARPSDLVSTPEAARSASSGLRTTVWATRLEAERYSRAQRRASSCEKPGRAGAPIGRPRKAHAGPEQDAHPGGIDREAALDLVVLEVVVVDHRRCQVRCAGKDPGLHVEEPRQVVGAGGEAGQVARAARLRSASGSAAGSSGRVTPPSVPPPDRTVVRPTFSNPNDRWGWSTSVRSAGMIAKRSVGPFRQRPCNAVRGGATTRCSTAGVFTGNHQRTRAHPGSSAVKPQADRPPSSP